MTRMAITRRAILIIMCGATLGVVAGCGGEAQMRPAAVGSDATARAAPAADAASLRFRQSAAGLPATGRWKSTPAVADVNHDGILDLAVHPRLERGPRAWLGDGKGGWIDDSKGLMTESSCGGAIQLADLNRDGHPDLVVADHCNGVYVYLGDGKGGWEMTTAKLLPDIARKFKKDNPEEGNKYSGTEVAAVGDINADGCPDIVAAASEDGGFSVFLGDCTGRNWKEATDSGLPNPDRPEPGGWAGGWAMDVQLVDMNGDGRLDVVASYYSGPRVWRGDGKGHFQDTSKGLLKTDLGGVYRRLSIGDINGDGRPDFAIANSINGAEAYLQNADGTWQGPIDMMPDLKGGAESVALGDLNGDGKLDVAIGGTLVASPASANPPYGLFVRLGDGKGGFVNGPSNLPRTGLEPIWGIRLVDINRDGRLDIVVATGGAFVTGDPMGRPALATPPGASGPVLQAQPAGQGAPQDKVPNIQVWINEGAGAR